MDEPRCVLCGWVIFRSTEATWLREFRGLIRQSPDGFVCLTGVGVHDVLGMPCLFAPPEPPNHEQGGDITMDDPDQSPEELELMPRRDVLMHDSCLQLLERYAPGICSDHTALERLYETCISLPYPPKDGVPNWGHDYGGLMPSRNDEAYPWEGNDNSYSAYATPHHAVYDANPLGTIDHESLLWDFPSQPPSVAFTAPETFTSRDAFSNLPLEICLQIAANLTTRDFLSARLASRGFHGIFYLRSF
ncbi:unnamed protein product [Clonostachys rosea]|uniref:F-box domain-containing protein n=1 Tax=Bionectria ochroleuca TaxID=29856 RepID=A0ABY6V051_BIOOC|nr:unnamed protein product [Clonostachys rosea]